MKKARKSKFVIGGVALLSCVALAGVGYSSWVITSTVTSQTGNVTVTAADVEDDRITIGTIGTEGTISDSYKFGPSDDTGGGLISASSDTSEESLSVSFSFTVSCATGMTFANLTKSYDITLALASNKTCSSGGDLSSEGMDALAYATSQSVTGTSSQTSGTYLAAPASGLVGSEGITIATVSSTGVSASNITSNATGSLSVSVTSGGTSDTSATITVTAAFGWGTYFGGTNPVNLTESGKLDDYVAGLNWLYSAFGGEGATFTYTIGGSVKAE